MLAKLETGSVVLRALKMTLVTGPQWLTSHSSDDRDQRQHINVLIWDDHNSQVNSVLQ